MMPVELTAPVKFVDLMRSIAIIVDDRIQLNA
jgi:hypothetical protein